MIFLSEELEVKVEMEIKELIKNLPITSGCYLMKDSTGKVIYVGKAVSLRKRVASYFSKSSDIHIKTQKLVEDIRDIGFIKTSSEAEALILEASLVKKYSPKYNIDLRDDKTYPYIQITNDVFPRISVERPHEFKSEYKYFGPYVNPKLIREALDVIRKIFLFRTCCTFPKKECLDYHINLCNAPCIGKISKTDYRQNIKNIILILDGKKDVLFKSLTVQMEKASLENNFEKAAKLRDQLRALGALFSGTRDINYFKEAEQIQRVLGLSALPNRIEAFDISNIYGNQPVGSMVSFFNGKPDKRNYRRFKIKDVSGIDDFRMIQEVVRRRYSRLKKEGTAYPDLILIDGGKGQLSSAVNELRELEVDIPIISLAKKQEEIFMPGKRNSITLLKNSLGLQLLQRIRDEAHRFAVSYHRKLRAKDFIKE